MNLALWKSRFKEHLELRHYSPRSVDGYTAELAPFFRFLDAQGVESLAAITRDVLEEYRAFLFEATFRGRRLSAATQAHRLCTVKVFTRFLAREQFIALDPGAGVDLPRVPQTLPRSILSEDEAERVMETSPRERPPSTSATGPSWRLLYCTAIRNQELRDLRLEDLSLDRGELRVERGKGAKGRMLPLGEEAIAWLKEYLARSRPHLVRSSEQTLLFLTYRGNRLARSELARIVRRHRPQDGRQEGCDPPCAETLVCHAHAAPRGRPAPVAGTHGALMLRVEQKRHNCAPREAPVN